MAGDHLDGRFLRRLMSVDVVLASDEHRPQAIGVEQMINHALIGEHRMCRTNDAGCGVGRRQALTVVLDSLLRPAELPTAPLPDRDPHGCVFSPLVLRRIQYREVRRTLQ
jgi:hypothetical protein